MYYYQIPPMGFEGIIFLSSVAVVLALLAGGMSLTLAAYLLLRRKPPKPLNAVMVSTIAIAIALSYVWAL
jgi:hypothetical protein